MTLTKKNSTAAIGEYLLDGTVKGIPGGTEAFPLSRIAARRWNVLRDELPFPLLVLKHSALLHNIEVMNVFLKENELSLAPHAKTHMSPQLADLQLQSGAWAITAGNVSQVQVFRKFGVERIILANQLVGRQSIRFIVEEINAHEDFEFYCLVDSVEGVRHLASVMKQFGLKRPIKVLLEGGYWGGRTGCRTIEQAKGVLAELRSAREFLSLAGIEGFEGSISKDSPAEALEEVRHFLDYLRALFAELEPDDFPGAKEVILSAGGSAYFDVVTKAFRDLDFFLPKRIVLRSGCYLTHDSRMYHESHEQRLARGWRGGEPSAAFEIWSYVQSIPEKGLAILTMGKRDAPYDYLSSDAVAEGSRRATGFRFVGVPDYADERPTCVYEFSRGPGFAVWRQSSIGHFAPVHSL